MCFWLLCQTVWFLVFLIITSFQSSSVFIFFSTVRQMPSLSLVYIMNHHVILITLLHPADLWQSAHNPYSAVTDVQVVRFTSCWCSPVELKGPYELVGRSLKCPQTGSWTIVSGQIVSEKYVYIDLGAVFEGKVGTYKNRHTCKDNRLKHTNPEMCCKSLSQTGSCCHWVKK